jgi:hypothetical protein|tara:strand:- start:22 stop:420 length:399 start_codon:yes stop_codon:yes gene_type:complete
MSHFAKIENNIVTEVIAAEKDFINSGLVGDEFLWVQTSYNNNFRKNYAGVGDTYDAARNAFIKPKPYPSYILNESTCVWEAPVTYPDDGDVYTWNETDQAWDLNEDYETENPFANNPLYEWNETNQQWDEIT